MADPKDLNPLYDILKNLIGPAIGSMIGKPGPGYEGQLRAPMTPMEQFAMQLAGRRATSGQLMAWKQMHGLLQPGNSMADMLGQRMAMQQMQGGGWNPGVQSFINTYLNGYPQGWNPYSGFAPSNTGRPPWAQGGGNWMGSPQFTTGGGGQPPRNAGGGGVSYDENGFPHYAS